MTDIRTYETTRWDAELGDRVIYTRFNSQPMTGMQDIERAPFGGIRFVWYRVTMRDDARTRYGVRIAVDKVYSDDRPADYTDAKTWVWYYMTAREAAAKALVLCRECGITDPYITGDVGGMCTTRDREMIAAGATWDGLCAEWYKAAATVTTREHGGCNDYCETVYIYSTEADTTAETAAETAETAKNEKEGNPMKYDLRKIMTRAWRNFRKGGMSFAEALHRSWLSAKAEPINARRIAEAQAQAGVTEQVNTWASWKALGREVIHGSKALFQAILLHGSKGDGATYKASFFAYSQTQEMPVTAQ